MSSKHSALALSPIDSPDQDEIPIVEVVLGIRADTLARVDVLCEACKPIEMTREKMLRVMVETGLLYWERGPGCERAEEVTTLREPGAPTRLSTDVSVNGAGV